MRTHTVNVHPIVLQPVPEGAARRHDLEAALPAHTDLVLRAADCCVVVVVVASRESTLVCSYHFLQHPLTLNMISSQHDLKSKMLMSAYQSLTIYQLQTSFYFSK
jgi:hypothetical protein